MFYAGNTSLAHYSNVSKKWHDDAIQTEVGYHKFFFPAAQRASASASIPTFVTPLIATLESKNLLLVGF
jgi:hypothetical protein